MNLIHIMFIVYALPRFTHCCFNCQPFSLLLIPFEKVY